MVSQAWIMYSCRYDVYLVTNLHKNSIYKPVEIKNQIPFPRVFAKMRIIKSSPPQIFVL